jgi:Cu2+-exporting ATPase
VYILVPNITCIVGVFTMGFGIAVSVLTNNVAALAALANGILPMRKVAALEAERRHMMELQLRASGFLEAPQHQLTDDLEEIREDEIGEDEGMEIPSEAA